jgi:hypothetical protein
LNRSQLGEKCKASSPQACIQLHLLISQATPLDSVCAAQVPRTKLPILTEDTSNTDQLLEVTIHLNTDNK